MADFLRDFRYAVRVLAKSPLITAVAILALALGIAVNASSFASISALILHPLPYPRLERIVTIWETLPKLQTQRTAMAPADFLDLKHDSRSFQELAALRAVDLNVARSGGAERVAGCEVSPSFFAVLGTKPMRGRTLGNGDERARAAVVSEGYWKAQLAASPTAIGEEISLNGQAYTIAGVMPDHFDYPLGTEIWIPLALTAAEEQERGTRSLMALGLLKPGVAPAQASAEAVQMGLRLERQYPRTHEGRGVLTVPLGEMTEEVTNHFVVTLLAGAEIGRASCRERV
jgi:putative ABC transport system permease protein